MPPSLIIVPNNNLNQCCVTNLRTKVRFRVFSNLGVHAVVLGQSDSMVESTASGVKRDRLRRPPHRLEVPGKVVRRRSRPRVVHYPDRLNVSTCEYRYRISVGIYGVV